MNLHKIITNRLDVNIKRVEHWYYKRGISPPKYPLPACDIDNLLAMPPRYITFKTKAILVRLVS